MSVFRWSFSSATLSINGSSVGDQFRPVKRALVFPILAWANITGMSAELAECLTDIGIT